MSAAAYVFTMVTLVVALFFAPRPPQLTIVLGGAAVAIGTIGLIYCRRSAFVLMHALQALLFLGLGCLVWLLPKVPTFDLLLVLGVVLCLAFKHALGGESGPFWSRR